MHSLVACCAVTAYYGAWQGRASTRLLQVLAEAHAVVLASGTLSPVASLSQQLFPGLAPDRLTHFSCGHVVWAGAPAGTGGGAGGAARMSAGLLARLMLPAAH